MVGEERPVDDEPLLVHPENEVMATGSIRTGGSTMALAGGLPSPSESQGERKRPRLMSDVAAGSQPVEERTGQNKEEDLTAVLAGPVRFQLLKPAGVDGKRLVGAKGSRRVPLKVFAEMEVC